MNVQFYAHIVHQKMNHGQTKEQIKAAEKQYTRNDISQISSEICVAHPELAEAVADFVWKELGYIDASRKQAEPGCRLYRLEKENEI